MKFVLILEEKRIDPLEENYPVKILENYVAVIGKPEQVVIFEANDGMDLAKFKEVFKDTQHQIIPIIDAKNYVENIKKDRIEIIKYIVKELEDLTEWGAPEEDILEKAEKAGIDKEKAKEILEKLKQKGNLYCPRYGYYKVAGYD